MDAEERWVEVRKTRKRSKVGAWGWDEEEEEDKKVEEEKEEK
jgi:hypothetical protein